MSSIKAFKSQFDLFSSPITEASTVDYKYIPVYPQANIKERYADVIFNILGDNSNYIDLSNSYLYLKCKVVNKDNSNLAEDTKVSLTNFFLHSLFSSVEVSLNNTVIEPTSNTYPYKSYINMLLGYDSEFKNSKGKMGLYYPDSSPGTNEDTNEGFKKRMEICKKSNVFEVMGPLFIDICQQSKYIPPNVNIRLKLRRSLDEFALLFKTDSRQIGTGENAATIVDPFKISIEEGMFMVKRVTPSPDLVCQHLSYFNKGNLAKYPMQKVEVKSFVVASGSTIATCENLFAGKLPNTLILGFVDSVAMQGKLSKNPFNFQNFGLSSCTISVDNNPSIYNEINFNFGDNKEYLIGYNSLLNISKNKIGNNITPADYLNGNFFIVYQLASTFLSKYALEKRGNLKIDLKFASALASSITVLAWVQYNSCLAIDKDLNVSIENE